MWIKESWFSIHPYWLHIALRLISNKDFFIDQFIPNHFMFPNSRTIDLETWKVHTHETIPEIDVQWGGVIWPGTIKPAKTLTFMFLSQTSDTCFLNII